MPHKDEKAKKGLIKEFIDLAFLDNHLFAVFNIICILQFSYENIDFCPPNNTKKTANSLNLHHLFSALKSVNIYNNRSTEYNYIQ